MPPNSIADASAALHDYFDTGSYSHAAAVALVLEQYAPDRYAWLRPETVTDPEPDDALWTPTQRGRDLVARWSAERACHGREVS